ncbi:MAG: hypothetical protein R3D27_13665 [Hyphomicrobiaceae bacterium]
MTDRLWRWLDTTVLDLARQMRWSFLPPLMVYFAAGVAGLTSIVGVFFIKDYLGLSAAFLAGLTFWTGIPWTLKMPLGHLVDLMWRWKSLLVYLGASLIASSLLIMYLLISQRAMMSAVMPLEAWYVLAALLSPVGYVVQDVVADAMTVEAVPTVRLDGTPVPEAEIKAAHTTMQTLGRFAIISGLVIVAALNIFMFSGLEGRPPEAVSQVYARIYLIALAIPLISVAGVILGEVTLARRIARMRAEGVGADEIRRALAPDEAETKPNVWLLGGGLAFALFTISVGASGMPLAKEVVFAGSMAIVTFLISRLIRELAPSHARALIGTAIIIFVFRAVPLPGPGLDWFQIDVLGFDQRFLAVLSLITSALALAGMVALRPLIAARSIADITVLLSIAAGVLALPAIGLYYGLHQWTSALTGGVVDARAIALINAAIESPLGQIAMIPMLAWIAQHAPANLKATFFAVMASFTNLALSASSLATRYLNEIFVVTREVRDRATGAVTVVADYSQLGVLLIVVAALGVALPVATVWLVQRSPLKTTQ